MAWMDANQIQLMIDDLVILVIFSLDLFDFYRI